MSHKEILYIGDCENTAAPLCALLRLKLCYDVHCLGVDALDALGSQPPNPLCIVDLPLPHLEQAVCAVHSHSPSTVILALAPFGDEEGAAISLAAGADDMLHKPLTLARLELSIRNLLRIQRLQQEVRRLRAA